MINDKYRFNRYLQCHTHFVNMDMQLLSTFTKDQAKHHYVVDNNNIPAFPRLSHCSRNAPML